MRYLSKLTFAALAATALLGFTVSTASANHLSTNERGFRITWASLEFNSGIGPVVRCPVTLEGEFSSATINKTANAVVGNNTGAVVGAGCTGGLATALRETLPWRISYESFTGTLPNITGIKLLLLGPRFQVETGGITCLARPTRLAAIIIGAIVGGNFKPERISEERETFACGILTSSRLEGEGVVTKRGSTERILITLI